MSRLSKFLLVFALVVFALACNLVTQPISDVQNLAGTAESIASAMPAETLLALASQIPIETLEALPSAIPDFENYFDPQGTPVQVWNDIPVMPQATAGQEFNATNYSYKTSATVQEAKDFYDSQMNGLGWSPAISMSGNDEGAILVFSKDDSLLTITISVVDATVVVLLTLA
jgi:hypothetical protein